MEKIGFIGLGIMGQGMARNLLKAGFGPVVWNRTASKTDAIVSEGATLAGSPADFAAALTFGLIMLFFTKVESAHVASVLVRRTRPDRNPSGH